MQDARSTDVIGYVIRTAPVTAPPEPTGTATYRRLVPSVAECRVPAAILPARARAISGRDAKSSVPGSRELVSMSA